MTKSHINWADFQGVSTCTIDGFIVGNVFPWGGGFAAAFQGQFKKQFTHKFEAKAHISGGAQKFYAANAHQNREFEVNKKDWARRDYAQRKKENLAKMKLEF